MEKENQNQDDKNEDNVVNYLAKITKKRLNLTDENPSKRFQKNSIADQGRSLINFKSIKSKKPKNEKKKKEKNKQPLSDIPSINDLLTIDIDAPITSQFQKISEYLLNNYILRANNLKFRLCELEFYFLHPKNHFDTFTRCEKMELEKARWSFHKNGKYFDEIGKSLDISFGQGDDSYGGIQIRSIMDLQNMITIDAPKLAVNKLLEVCTNTKENPFPKIYDFIHDPNFNFNVTSPGILYLEKSNELPKWEVLSSPRIRLSLKDPDMFKAEYLIKPYRFFVQPKNILKGKEMMIVAGLIEGKTKKKIMSTYGVTASCYERVKTNFENGAKSNKKESDYYFRDYNITEAEFLLGLLHEKFKNKT